MSRRLKEHNPSIHVLGVDPEGSLLARPDSLNKSRNAVYKIEGIGYDFIPGVLKHDMITSWIKTTDEGSFAAARELIRFEGMLVGGSSGAALSGALAWLKMTEEGKKIAEDPSKTVVIILPDGLVSRSRWLAEDLALTLVFRYSASETISRRTGLSTLKLSKRRTYTSILCHVKQFWLCNRRFVSFSASVPMPPFSFYRQARLTPCFSNSSCTHVSTLETCANNVVLPKPLCRRFIRPRKSRQLALILSSLSVLIFPIQ